jgi:hypothetical protein
MVIEKEKDGCFGGQRPKETVEKGDGKKPKLPFRIMQR